LGIFGSTKDQPIPLKTAYKYTYKFRLSIYPPPKRTKKDHNRGCKEMLLAGIVIEEMDIVVWKSDFFNINISHFE
jgi:hypothetical protein